MMANGIYNIRTLFLAAASLGVMISTAQADLLFSDNFNAPDNANFDAAPLAGRLNGLVSDETFLRSARVLQQISGNQLSMVSASSGRVRFQNAPSGAGWYDWAAGAGAAKIIAGGGLLIEFDLTGTDDVQTDWVSFNIGHSGETAGEPTVRVNDAQTDYAILFRNNGGTQRFDNGVATTTGNFDPAGTQHVAISFEFDSFDDGTLVNAIARVDGQIVDSYTFDWNNNNGELYFELGTIETGSLIDNFSVSTLPEPASVAVWSLLGLALVGYRRRRNKRS
jgi:MYXO-CTERM domain-containing protein